MKRHAKFEGKEDFEAYNKAGKFLKENGFSYGSMERDKPIGIMYGDYNIAKWRNLDSSDRDNLHGQMTAETSFRFGPVFVDIYDDTAPHIGFKAES